MRFIQDPAPLAAAVLATFPEDREVLGPVLTAQQCRDLRALAEAPATVPVLHKHGLADADLDYLLHYVDKVFAAIAALRSGDLILDGSKDPETLARLADWINVLEVLNDRFSGLSDALIRAHHAAGGTGAELATALESSKSAAHKRSFRVRTSEPSVWERWATGETDPDEHLAADVRPGWTLLDDNDRRHQVQLVNVYGDGVVEVETSASSSFAYTPGEKVQAVPRTIPMQETTGTVGIGTPEGPVPVTTYSRARRMATRRLKATPRGTTTS